MSTRFPPARERRPRGAIPAFLLMLAALFAAHSGTAPAARTGAGADAGTGTGTGTGPTLPPGTGRGRRTAVLTSLLALLAGWAGLYVPAVAQAAGTSTSITVDGSQPGLTFDGVGAISGGGGNSRLLIDYPEPQRSQLLDYLFKPGYGASLQVLKIEIGGDTNSTDGAEASHERAKGVVDCNQGYEWWLAAQAKARNPNIKLYGLAWGAPGWITADNPGVAAPFWTTDTINYLTDWFGCATQHNLAIDYIGGWNERSYTAPWSTQATWYAGLKSALASHGYGATKIVGSDDSWAVADDMVTDPTLRNAVDIIGVHYPCGYGGSFTSCQSTANARSLGKPLWASENGSESTDGTSTFGAPSVARGINRDYIDGRMTSFINWPAIAALYPNLFFSDQGMSIANQPWSGNYHIGKTTWVTAQTTQFTQPGWHYIDSASGYLGGSNSNGSYVSLKSTNNSDYSTVIETMDATAAQTLNLAVAGGLSTGTVHVWATNVNSANSADYFVHTQDVTPTAGHYTVTLQPGYVYTLTTLATGGKGTATSPAAAPMALPYSDTFETPAASTSPKYFSDMEGAFQTVPCGAGRAGTCLRQMATARPINWTDQHHYEPYTIMGDGSWTNYTVSTDSMLEQPGSVEVLGRINQQGRNNNGVNAYVFRVSDTGAWQILKSTDDSNQSVTALAGGTVSALGLNKWHTIALTMQDATLTASVDGVNAGSVTDYSYAGGQAGLGVIGTVNPDFTPLGNPYLTEQFDNFSLTPGTVSPLHIGPITSALAGKCADDFGNSAANSAKVDLYDCNGTAAQSWTSANGALQINGKCMDVTGAAAVPGTLVELWDCNGGANQQWTPQANGTLRSGLQSASHPAGLCLDDPGASTANGTQLIIWDCSGNTNQQWKLP